jgi:hypothetical protein
MDGSIVWKINCATKHGVDVVLVRGDSKPTKKQLDKIHKRMLVEYGIDKDDERCYVEIAGRIGIRDIPFTEDYLKQEIL